MNRVDSVDWYRNWENICLDVHPSYWSFFQSIINALSSTLPPALALCATAHILPSCHHGVPVCLWTWTGLPGQRPSAGRQESRSTTPAVIVDVGIGLSDYTTVHCQRPSVSRRRSTNMEQFASWSDVIKFPANLHNQTKIVFILGVVSIVSWLL